MEKIITAIVPGQPVPKARPRFSSKSGTAYTPKRTKEYETRIKKHVKPLVNELVLGPVHIHINVVFKRPKYMHKNLYSDGLILHTKRPDLDNVIKAVLDALNSILNDDSQVCKISATKYYAEKQHEPRTEISISKL